MIVCRQVSHYGTRALQVYDKHEGRTSGLLSGASLIFKTESHPLLRVRTKLAFNLKVMLSQSSKTALSGSTENEPMRSLNKHGDGSYTCINRRAKYVG